MFSRGRRAAAVHGRTAGRTLAACHSERGLGISGAQSSKHGRPGDDIRFKVRRRICGSAQAVVRARDGLTTTLHVLRFPLICRPTETRQNITIQPMIWREQYISTAH